jgi:hypothetical protein
MGGTIAASPGNMTVASMYQVLYAVPLGLCLAVPDRLLLRLMERRDVATSVSPASPSVPVLERVDVAVFIAIT